MINLLYLFTYILASDLDDLKLNLDYLTPKTTDNPSFLIMTPVRDGADFIIPYMHQVQEISKVINNQGGRVHLCILEGDSQDRSLEKIKMEIFKNEEIFKSIELFTLSVQENQYILHRDRHDETIQGPRRTALAKSRNAMISSCMGGSLVSEGNSANLVERIGDVNLNVDYTVWIDVDAIGFNRNILKFLSDRLSENHLDAIVPNVAYNGYDRRTYDLNSWTILGKSEFQRVLSSPETDNHKLLLEGYAHEFEDNNQLHLDDLASLIVSAGKIRKNGRDCLYCIPLDRNRPIRLRGTRETISTSKFKVPVDLIFRIIGVGTGFLLTRANLYSELGPSPSGWFPTKVYHGRLESEGFGIWLSRNGKKIGGLPFYSIAHLDQPPTISELDEKYLDFKIPETIDQ